MTSEAEIVVRFTRDEAFVMSDWIFRLQQDKVRAYQCVDDVAVWGPLHKLGGVFETQRLDAARQRILAGLGDFRND